MLVVRVDIPSMLFVSETEYSVVI